MNSSKSLDQLLAENITFRRNFHKFIFFKIKKCAVEFRDGEISAMLYNKHMYFTLEGQRLKFLLGNERTTGNRTFSPGIIGYVVSPGISQSDSLLPDRARL